MPPFFLTLERIKGARIPPAAFDAFARVAAPALLSVALVILIVIAGIDAARSLRDLGR